MESGKQARLFWHISTIKSSILSHNTWLLSSFAALTTAPLIHFLQGGLTKVWRQYFRGDFSPWHHSYTGGEEATWLKLEYETTGFQMCDTETKQNFSAISSKRTGQAITANAHSPLKALGSFSGEHKTPGSAASDKRGVKLSLWVDVSMSVFSSSSAFVPCGSWMEAQSTWNGSGWRYALSVKTPHLFANKHITHYFVPLNKHYWMTPSEACCVPRFCIIYVHLMPGLCGFFLLHLLITHSVYYQLK